MSYCLESLYHLALQSNYRLSLVCHSGMTNLCSNEKLFSLDRRMITQLSCVLPAAVTLRVPICILSITVTI